MDTIRWCLLAWKNHKNKHKNPTIFKNSKNIERDQLQNKTIPNLIRFWSDEVDQALKTSTIFELILQRIEEKLI
jgi:small-conductance mechanosensitive channel